MTLQNQVGVCAEGTGDFGCANLEGEGAAGNPNDAANCFDVREFGGAAPFKVNAVRFWLGPSIPVPPDVKILVWDGSVAGGPIGNPIATQAISGYDQGENTFSFNTPVEIDSNEVCVGIQSKDEDFGLRLETEEGSGEESYIVAPVCGGPVFVSLRDLTVSGFLLNFCIEAIVSG